MRKTASSVDSPFPEVAKQKRQVLRDRRFGFSA